jgi:ABC-type enterochelin transport system ATPase subunit
MLKGTVLLASVLKIVDSVQAWNGAGKQQMLSSMGRATMIRRGATGQVDERNVDTWSSALLAFNMAINISRSPSPRKR